MLPMDVRKQFGQILKRMRAERGLTQEELAFRAGMNVTYLSDIERGESSPSLVMLADIACALDVQLSELLRDVEVLPRQSGNGRKRPKDE